MQNSSFSQQVPHLQLAWDSTSLGAFKECPRKYQLGIVLGKVPRRESVHLSFGQHYHSALEAYDHAKAAGADHAAAMIVAVRRAMDLTWNKALGRPWISDDPNKNRMTLIRSVVWYLDQFEDDPVQTVILANGKPAVELSFRMRTSYTTAGGEPFMLCGHLDRLGIFQGDTYILDRKTSKSQLTEGFFAKFSPDNQFTLYTLASKIVYGTPVRGLIVDGAQIAVTFTRFQRGFVARTEAQLEEWYRDLGIWLTYAEHCANQSYWPMNDKSCNNYGGCPYREICSKSPSIRDQWLSAEFHDRTWDPLQIRGDI